MMGIIHSIMRLVEACLSSAAGMVLIFCWAQVVTPTRMGMIRGEGSGLAKSIQRKWLFKGTVLCTTGSQE